jgi:hypothetical protein
LKVSRQYDRGSLDEKVLRDSLLIPLAWIGVDLSMCGDDGVRVAALGVQVC